MVPQIYLAHWARLRVFKGLGKQVCRSASGARFNWGNLAIYGKGVSTLKLPGQQTPGLLKVCCPIMPWFFGSIAEGGSGV